MRLLTTQIFVPFILVAMLIQAPAIANGNTNQQMAERIADSIGNVFPSADIDVLYKGGQVWLQGEAVSQDQRKKIVEHVFNVTGVNVKEVNDEIAIVAPREVAPRETVQRPAATPAVASAPIPMPRTPVTRLNAAPEPNTSAPMVATNARQVETPAPVQHGVPQNSAPLAPYPHQHYPAAYGVQGQVPYAVAPQHAHPAHHAQQYPPVQHRQQQHQPAYYGPPAGAAHHPEAYGPQGPLPGNYNQPNLPNYAWPAYANYPNYAQVSYPRVYSPRAWPYIGPFYPYPQVPLGWRKVTLEHSNGNWWLDFNDGSPTGPYSGLFRQPRQYSY